MARAATPFAEAQPAVQRLLAEHGCCALLELLLAVNWLDYEDYLAWRRGERATLDDSLHRAPSGVEGLVKHMEQWGRELDLQAQGVVLYGIEENAGAQLRASADPRLDEFLRTEFQPASGRSQLDLFLDTAEAAACADVAAAIAGRDADAAQARLERLLAINPRHWAVADARTLIEALRASAPGEADAAAWLDAMERSWRPAACALLHGEARDFLTPMWRALGAALESLPFDFGQPTRHPAWAYLNGLDWGNARRAVLATADYEDQPALLGWLAEAEWKLRDAKAAYARWFALCWRSPDHFEALIDHAGFPDAMLKQAWLDGRDAALDPEITPGWFPAWVAATKPVLARTFARCGGGSDGERAFDAMVGIVVANNDREEMDSRSRLRDLHPGLLSAFLEGVEE